MREDRGGHETVIRFHQIVGVRKVVRDDSRFVIGHVFELAHGTHIAQ